MKVGKVKIKKPPPHEFVLERLERIGIHTKAMFGALGVYVGERMVLILRDKEAYPEDNGVWVVSDPEYHASLQTELPSLRPIKMFEEGGPGRWKNIPSSSPTFEEESYRVCELILKRDPRVGRVPDRKNKKKKIQKKITKKPVKKLAKKKPANKR